ncbi:MAG: hypothetical protein JNM51_01815 [Bacteroidia bacterium]|nr:hypothetical protein [Bacteroidia bacterium]
MNNDIPEYHNFYSFFNSPTKTELRIFLEQNGWTIRKESWNDFECTNDWSELYLHADEINPLLNGAIANSKINYQKLVDLFCGINAKFQAELYDKDKILLKSDKILV